MSIDLVLAAPPLLLEIGSVLALGMIVSELINQCGAARICRAAGRDSRRIGPHRPDL